MDWPKPAGFSAVERYTAAAAQAADFLLANLRDGQGRLQRTFAGGKAKVPAYLDDYAFLVDALIALHRATGDERWLRAAGDLTEAQIELFWDERVGGFFYTSTLHEQLIARSKMPNDNVTPSGNSASAANLLYLAKALDRPEYISRAEKCIQSAGPVLQEHPAAVVQLAVALAAWLDLSGKSPGKGAPQRSGNAVERPTCCCSRKNFCRPFARERRRRRSVCGACAA